MVQEVFALYAYPGLCGIYGFIGLCGARLYVGLCIQLSLGVWGHVGLCKILESFSTDDEHNYEYEFSSFSQLYS